jgi:hypothetical protein
MNLQRFKGGGRGYGRGRRDAGRIISLFMTWLCDKVVVVVDFIMNVLLLRLYSQYVTVFLL